MSVPALRRVLALATTSVVLTLGMGTVASVALPATAFADSTYSMESQFVAKMNAARQANGLPAYSVASDLTSVARSHSQTMASKQSLYHNPSLTSDVQNWQAVGENVGDGPTVDDLHTAFMNSPDHRANILDHDFTQVGVGVSVDKDGTIWVTEDFRQPMSSSSTSTSSPTHTSSQQSAPTPTSSGSTSTYSAPAASPVTARPAPVRTPQEVLRHRLHQLRQHHHATHASDPVAQSFDYVATLSRLAG